jgi:hypothetical protein
LTEAAGLAAAAAGKPCVCLVRISGLLRGDDDCARRFCQPGFGEMGSPGRRWRGRRFVKRRGDYYEPDVSDGDAWRLHDDDRNSAGKLERGESRQSDDGSHDHDDFDDDADDNDDSDEGRVGERTR